jgi:hypothetical protein
VASLLILLGELDGGEALEQTLSETGLEARPGADAGALVGAQMSGSMPLDGYTWSRLAGAAVIRLLPGTGDGLEPDLARAISATTHGLVPAMEAIRTRDRYIVGSFLSGRTSGRPMTV